MKICTVCKQEKNIEEFSYKNKSLGKRHSHCKDCQKKMVSKHYVENKKYYYDKNVNRRIDFKDWLHNIKISLICEKCGENHPATLDFHHIDPNEKNDSISNMIRNGVSKKIILEEIKKCSVLCSNCHRKHHWECY